MWPWDRVQGVHTQQHPKVTEKGLYNHSWSCARLSGYLSWTDLKLVKYIFFYFILDKSGVIYLFSIYFGIDQIDVS